MYVKIKRATVEMTEYSVISAISCRAVNMALNGTLAIEMNAVMIAKPRTQ